MEQKSLFADKKISNTTDLRTQQYSPNPSILKASNLVSTVASSYKRQDSITKIQRGISSSQKPSDQFFGIGATDGVNNSLLMGIEGERELQKTKNDLDETIKDLDIKLNRVLAKQEYEYLKGYNMYVKKKEKELRELIARLTERTSNATYKDQKIRQLESSLTNVKDEQLKTEKRSNEIKEQISKWKIKVSELESENKFLKESLTDTKKKNKLLKIAIGKLQSDIDKANGQSSLSMQQSQDQMKQFFITDLLNTVDNSNQQHNSSNNVNKQQLTQTMDNSLINDLSTLQTSLMEPSSIFQTKSGKKITHKRVQSVSRYANIPTENIKFNQFIDLIFTSKMGQSQVKDEIKNYITALETNYNQTIRDLKIKIEKLEKQLKQQRSQSINQTVEKNDLEELFVESIEEVRKDVMKRRLKNEVLQRKKMTVTDPEKDEAAKQFEESLLKLASLAKGRIRITDFNSRDKFNLLDLFVNNEKTLIKIYEVLFPHRKNQDLKSGYNSVGIAQHRNNESFDQEPNIEDNISIRYNDEENNDNQNNNNKSQMFPKISNIGRDTHFTTIRASSLLKQ